MSNELDNWLPLETRTLRENVTDLIRRAIIEGRLEADSELNQAQLAERLGISRGPVREALLLEPARLLLGGRYGCPPVAHRGDGTVDADEEVH